MPSTRKTRAKIVLPRLISSFIFIAYIFRISSARKDCASLINRNYFPFSLSIGCVNRLSGFSDNSSISIDWNFHSNPNARQSRMYYFITWNISSWLTQPFLFSPHLCLLYVITLCGLREDIVRFPWIFSDAIIAWRERDDHESMHIYLRGNTGKKKKRRRAITRKKQIDRLHLN